MKQSNYLLLFVAPLAILAALAMHRFSRKLRLICWAAMTALSLPLIVLEQQSYKVVVSNSKAVFEYAKTHPEDLIFGTQNNVNVTLFEALSRGDVSIANRVHQLPKDASAPLPTPIGNGGLIVVKDRETIHRRHDNNPLEKIPFCWESIGKLTPVGLGFSADFSAVLGNIVSKLPEPFGSKLSAPFKRLAEPKPAHLWRVPVEDPWCQSINIENR